MTILRQINICLRAVTIEAPFRGSATRSLTAPPFGTNVAQGNCVRTGSSIRHARSRPWASLRRINGTCRADRRFGALDRSSSWIAPGSRRWARTSPQPCPSWPTTNLGASVAFGLRPQCGANRLFIGPSRTDAQGEGFRLSTEHRRPRADRAIGGDGHGRAVLVSARDELDEEMRRVSPGIAVRGPSTIRLKRRRHCMEPGVSKDARPSTGFGDGNNACRKDALRSRRLPLELDELWSECSTGLILDTLGGADARWSCSPTEGEVVAHTPHPA